MYLFFFFVSSTYSAFKVIKKFRLHHYLPVARSGCFSHHLLWECCISHRTAVQETWVQSLGRETPLEKEMATHSRILAWRIPWTGSLGGCSPRDHKGLDMTEQITFSLFSHRTSPENPQCCRIYESIPWKWIVAPFPKLGTSFCLIRQQEMKQFFVVPVLALSLQEESAFWKEYV